jgi:hypothetical protein
LDCSVNDSTFYDEYAKGYFNPLYLCMSEEDFFIFKPAEVFFELWDVYQISIGCFSIAAACSIL